MPPRLTTKEFIDRARTIHGDKYGYAFSVYQSAHEKVMIHCHEHGIFEQSPTDHTSGKGCKKCGVESKKHTNESFIEKARVVHGDKYDYSPVEYVNVATKITISCPKHGTFEQRPNSHLHGVGCPGCADTKHTNESFIEKAREFHGDKYGYVFSIYQSAHEKVMIHCPEHGMFEQSPASHLHGQGCPGCANHGFDRTKKGFLYVLRSDCGQYMKIGITNKPDQRQAQLSRATPFSFKRIELIEGTGDQTADLEKELLVEYQPAEFTERFSGSTEWRLWDDSIRHKLSVFKIQG